MLPAEGGAGGGEVWVPVPRARAAPPGVRTEALSSGQALAAGPHALCLRGGGA